MGFGPLSLLRTTALDILMPYSILGEHINMKDLRWPHDRNTVPHMQGWKHYKIELLRIGALTLLRLRFANDCRNTSCPPGRGPRTYVRLAVSPCTLRSQGVPRMNTVV